MPRSARKTSIAAPGVSKKAMASTKRSTSEHRHSTSTASQIENDEDGSEKGEDDGESAAVVERPRKRTKREPAVNPAEVRRSMSRSKSSRKKEKEEDEDEDEDETMEEAVELSFFSSSSSSSSLRRSTRDRDRTPVVILSTQEIRLAQITPITADKYGRIFTGKENEEKQCTSQRSNLQPILVHAICDFLSDRSLFILARVSPSAYAMVREYGELVVLAESKRSVASDPLGDDIEFMSSAAGSVNPHPQHRVGQRSMQVSDLSNRSSKLVQSQLRHLVTSIELCGGLELAEKVSRALPYMRTLIIPWLPSTKKIKKVVLPQYVRSLSIRLEERMGSTTNSKKEWNSFITNVTTVIGELEYLNEFRLTNPYFCSFRSSGTGWISSITRAPRLRLLSSGIDIITTKELLHAFSSTLISFSHRKISSPDDPVIYKLMHDERSASKRLRLQNFDCCRLLKDDFITSLSPFASTLTSLTPLLWSTKQVRWVSVFTQLKVLTINTSTNEKPRHYSREEDEDLIPIWTSTEGITLVMTDLVDALCRLTHLTRLRLYVHRLENDQLETILTSLVSLEHLGIGSNDITSITYLSQIPHLVNRLDTLIMRLPKLPRDEIVHLYSLKWLSSLDISSSFSEPLYARQLFPFKSPPTQQQQQQPYLRRFIPRSPNEAVPIPPIDLALQAAQRTEFNERVQSGQVCSAEMMNSDQLSLILQQLDCKEFSFAARTCRSWRSAASLKSAWSSGNTGRILILEGDSPECVPSIMPQLPLWCYARRVRFYADTSPHRAIRYPPRSSLADPLTTVSQLTRLESLDLQCVFPQSSNPNDVSPLLTSLLSCVESRLTFLRLQIYYAPGDSHWPGMLLQEFSDLKTLELNFSVYHPEQSSFNWMAMTALHTIRLNQPLTGSGHALRQLSLKHQLRCVHLHFKAGRLIPQAHQQFLEELTACRSLMPTTTKTQPAAITTFHLSIEEAMSLAPLDGLCDLSQLTDLRLEVTPAVTYTPTLILEPIAPFNFSQIDQKNAFHQVQRFFYSGPIESTQLVHLAHMKQLRSCTLIDSWHLWYTRNTAYNARSWSRPNSSAIPVGCMTQWLKSWIHLNEFHLEGIQVVGSELKELTRAKYLRRFTLHHVSTTPLSASDFTFLTECVHLHSIQLKCVLGLTLTPRHTWFDGASPVTVQERSNDQDGDVEMKSDKPEADISSSSLIDTLRACSELTQFLWCLHSTELGASVELTQLNVKFGGRPSLSNRRQREWSRERFTLKTQLRPTLPTGSNPLTSSPRTIFISYHSCIPVTRKQSILGTLSEVINGLHVANALIVISSSHTIDAKDPDQLMHQKEIRILHNEKMKREAKDCRTRIRTRTSNPHETETDGEEQ